MDNFFLTVLNMSLTGSIVIIAVLLIRILLKRTPKVFSYLLWIIVLFRLICPFALTTSFGMPQVLVNNQISFHQNRDQNMQNIGQPNEMETNAGQKKGDITEQSYLNSAIDGDKNNNSISNSSVGKRIFFVADVVWQFGIIILLIYSAASYRRLKKKLKSATFSGGNIYELEKLPTPFVLGIFKPSIYLPTGIAGEEREYILAHEKMHIRRLDYIVKLIGFLVVILHWMNPLVWIAFICMTKDMEMSCDEAVIRNLGTEIKKDYSTSLLHMAMPQHGFNMAPLAFGEGNVKERIKNVLKYKKTGIGILVICVGFLIFAAIFLTTNRADLKNQMRLSIVRGTDVWNSDLLQEHKLNADAKSYMVFLVSFEDGQELERNVLASGNITDENRNGSMNISFQYTDEEDYRVTIAATENATSQFMTYALSDNTMRAGNVLWADEKAYHDINTNVPYLLATEYVGSENTTGIEAFDCEDLMNDETTWNAAMKQSQDAGISMFMVYYVIFDKNIEEFSVEPEMFVLYDTTADAAEKPVLDSSNEQLSLIEPQISKWAQAFCDRDGEVIISMISDELKEQMTESGMLEIVDGGTTASFGASSPWPMEPENAYRIINMNLAENTAEILYYAVVSEPHVSVWQEKISFSFDGTNFLLTGEKIDYLDNIGSIDEYKTAYPDEIIDETMMDYVYNGMGKSLNDNALLSSSNFYKDLFQPDTAVMSLLNLDESKVEANWGYMDDGTEDVFVQLIFSDSNEMITIKMVQPYGSEGIWIPKNIID